MAQVKFAAMLGAAAFSAGVVLAAPLPATLAHADTTDASSSARDGDGEPAARSARRSAAAHAATPKQAAVRGGSDGRSAEADAPEIDIAVPKPHRGSSVPAAVTVKDLPDLPGSDRDADASDSGAPVAPPFAPAATSAEPPGASAPPPTSAAPPPSPPAPQAVSPTPVVLTAPAQNHAAAPVAAAAQAVSSVTPGVSARASSSASLIDSLLAPIRTIFGEGTALLVRRAFFNQAPSVTPVQLTGQSEGPITGKLNAVDPDGDPLSYSITADPAHGSAVVNRDGSYTYTPATGFAGNDSFVVAVTDTGFHINLLDLFRPASTSASVAVSQGALASLLRFQFVYGAGSQFWSSTARSALESAATQLSSYIVVKSPVTITFDVTGESSPFSDTLASAGSDFINDGSGFLQTVVQNKIQTGYDANGSTADGTIEWNFGRSWGFGSSVSANDYDFQSTAMHELLHTFGFLSNIDKAGSNTGRIWTVYDSYVVNAAGTQAINQNTFGWNTAFNPNLTGGNGGLYLNGPRALAANYGAKVTLYTPSTWASGSSMSHITADTLMNSTVSKGRGPRVLSPVELGILADIGYTVNPGPGTPVVLFVGLVSIRQRRRKD